MKINLSQGQLLITDMFHSGLRIFTTQDAHRFGKERGISEQSVNIILSRLEKRGIVRRLRRGLYTSVGILGELAEVHPFAISAYLIQPSAISHWSALQYHGLTDQIPSTIMASTPLRVYTPSMRTKKDDGKLKHSFIIDNVRYEYFTVQQKHFDMGLEKIWIDPHFQISITDKERTLIDLFVYHKTFGGMGEALGILEESLPEINVEQLVKYAKDYHEKALAKRIGWALDHFDVNQEYLTPLINIPMVSYCPLDPSRPKLGPCESKWMIQNNLVKRK